MTTNANNLPVYDEVCLALKFSLESILEDRRVPVVIPPASKRRRHKTAQIQNRILNGAKS